jgi:hypothetical protein
MLQRRANGEITMQDRRTPTSRTRAAREDTAGRVFLFWIAAWAILTLSLFAFHGTGAQGASIEADHHAAVRIAQATGPGDADDTPIVASLVNLY